MATESTTMSASPRSCGVRAIESTYAAQPAAVRDERYSPPPVSDRNHVLRRVRDSDERLQAIIDNTRDVIVILDQSGVIEYHNPSLERTLGYSPDELTASPFIDLVHPADSRQALEFLQELPADRHGHRSSRIRVRHRGGSWRTLEMLATQMQDGERSLLVNARDVTERELLERQLLQANRLAGLGRLAATVAHEFNNVLMGMQPFAELLQRAATSPAMLETCSRHICASIQRGKRVALDILRFTQPATPVLKPIDLAACWARLFPELHAQTGNQILFVSDVPAGTAVVADGAQLAQVFSNLVVNARDAMPTGGSLTVSVCEPRRDGCYAFGVVPDASSFVHIQVSDTGLGIPEEIRGNVFDPLFTTKENGGTGLGLAVAHQVITRHRGHIFVESEVGIGTTFHLFIPKASTPVTDESEKPLGRIAVRARRLLVVDDEEAIVSGLATLLEYEGFVVETARTGEEATMAAERFRPDLALLDIGLPDADGREVARRLRLRDPSLPVVFASGHGDREQIDGARSTFLQKPFEIDALLRAIAELERRSEVCSDV